MRIITHHCPMKHQSNTSLATPLIGQESGTTHPEVANQRGPTAAGRWFAGVFLLLNLQACAVVAVADAAVTVVATGVKVTAKAVGAVASAVIPDGDGSQ